MTPCKLELDVLPLDTVDMYGEPDKNSAYSLSGHVEVKLTPPTSLLSDPPASEERFSLESLVLTFEGQSELLAPGTGYAACRLIEFSQELIQNGPVEIGHYWDENLRDPQRWLITFNLAIPGWLPPTCNTLYGDRMREEPEVSYRLSAKATYRDMRPGSSKSLRSMCYGYSNLPSTQTTTSPASPVRINRYALPPPQHTLASSEFPRYPFHSVEFAGSVTGPSNSRVPADVLSKLRVLAYIPEHIPMDSKTFPLYLRLRPEGLTAEERKRLRVPKFAVSATQTELSRSSISKTYAEKWPVPPPSEQPPKKALRARRTDVREYECGLLLSAPPSTSAKNTYSILPTDFPDYFSLHDTTSDTGGFADAAFDDPNTWVQMRLDVPFRDVLVNKDQLEQYEDMPLPKLRPSERGPLLSVVHALDVVFICSYDSLEGGASGADGATDELRLTLPLSFVRMPRRNPYHSTTELPGVDSREAMLSPPISPYSVALPAYNQLYYSNGTLREDPTPLPRYTRNPEDAEDPPLPPVVCKQTPPTKLPLSPSAETTGTDSITTRA
ncbi:hypothetical protein PYCCODRAFT_1462594 [Trametes coccinea BRFM310]|uniref:Arrestin-like N-terminal domain-containing protein n=1 Tax=Trametes coccinea (strain BRFM310) TaxID=1353009 RepID=A0A1Y2J4N7_TRAC3|nr:hypothetical protein PYCCODRAFT_1462594 [Trametes coccinea BRFM310]